MEAGREVDEREREREGRRIREGRERWRQEGKKMKGREKGRGGEGRREGRERWRKNERR